MNDSPASSPAGPPLDRATLVALAETIEPLPATAAGLSSLLCRSEWMLRDVEDVVRLDLGLTSRVLRCANTAWTAHLPTVATLREAIMRIGVGTVLSLAIADGIRPRLVRPLRAFDLQPGRLWQHAVASALAAELIIRRTAADIRPEAVTGALLHDVGKVLLDEVIDEAMLAALREAWTRQAVSRVEAERAVLGIDHATLGGLVVRQWNLPETLVDAVTNHHLPSAHPTPTGDAVHLANGIAKLAGFGPLIAEVDGPVERETLERLGLEPADIHSLCTDLSQRMQTGQERFH
jgi:putative nucleotidyltransferase with HDIG domain